MSTSPEEPGTLLVGKYRVEQLIGEGGMGVVVAARHEQLNQRVAMKFLLPKHCADRTIVDRFLREARAAVQITTEHVARVLDVGVLDDNTTPYMVMEYLDGHDLSEEVNSKGKVPVRDAVNYLLQASEAVAEAHRLGIVHRDLKPGNLFLTSRADGSPLVKVLDFGISKVREGEGTEDASLTKTQTMLGSPLYASPEQLRDAKGVDERTDIWALGVVLYELITGEVPFDAETLTGLVSIILSDPAEPMARYCEDVPPELQAVVDRCLAKNRADRYPNVAELAQALVPFAPRSARISAQRITRLLGSQVDIEEMPPSIAAPPLQPEPAPSDAPPTPPAANSTTRVVGSPHGSTTAPLSSEAVESEPEQKKSRSGLLVGAAAAAAIVIGGVVVLALHSSHTTSATAAAAPSAQAAPSAAAANTATPQPSAKPAPKPEVKVTPAASAAPEQSAAPTPSAAPPPVHVAARHVPWTKPASTQHWHAPAHKKAKPAAAGYDPLAARK